MGGIRKLSQKQIEVLEFCHDFIYEQERPPHDTDIAEATGRSITGVQTTLRGLMFRKLVGIENINNKNTVVWAIHPNGNKAEA